MGPATLPLTTAAQREIFAHQHPADCSRAKYLMLDMSSPTGIGAALHVAGVGLQLALDLGRIFIEGPNSFLAPSSDCGAGSTTLDSCYLLPFAGCRPTPDQLRRAMVLDKGASGDENDGGSKGAGADVVLAFSDNLLPIRARAPKRFQTRLAATAIHPAKQYYWWRAQAAAYLLRPRRELLAEVEVRRRQALVGTAPSPGCISVHVRHGDKAAEAETFPDEVYDATAGKVRALDPSRFTDQIFVSTEDPATIRYFTSRAVEGAWRASYTDVPRKPSTGLAADLGSTLPSGSSREEFVNSLLNLDLALECDAFVGSVYSNWVRLIDELRSTLRCKADAVFADVRYANPHEMDLNW